MRGRKAKSILLCAVAAALATPTAFAVDPPSLLTTTTVPLPTSTSVPLPTSTSVPLPTSTSVPLPVPPPPLPTSATAAPTPAERRRFETAERAAALIFTPIAHPVAKLHTTRTWVRSGSRRSVAKIVFRLHRGGVVHFVVTQVSPRCRRVGAFAVRAHRGRNTVVLRGRLHGRPLPVGTYVLSATVRGRPLVGVTVVVAASRPTARELARARSRNACAAVLVRRVFFSTTIFRAPAGSNGPLAAAP